MLFFCSNFSSAALRWGLDNEVNACNEYKRRFETTVTPTGFTLHSDYPYLGASADGMTSGNTVLEIKCPYSGRDKTIAQLVASGYKHLQFNSENKLCMNVASHYYSQVQGEMAIKKVNMCHFIVWTPLDMAVIEVPFDDNYWHNTLLPALRAFYESRILPKLM